MEITVLCKVVDNFGDIGVVWRLCKRFKEIDPSIKINLITDDLVSFKKIFNKLSVEVVFQSFMGIDIYDWKNYAYCYEVFRKNDGEKLSIILENFQCGRPDWMEKILFEEKLNRTVNIIMIDYLTAEKYAEDFHCLKSLTRSAKVQKVNFMPGFTPKTGGLIIDSAWEKSFKRKRKGPALIFTYGRDWTPLAQALNKTSYNSILAPGKGFDSFKKAYNEIEKKRFQLEELDFMNQEDWDLVMKKCSVLFIRGEESLSRACLSGIPFVWHAYPQSEEYQLVKVDALLDRISEYFEFDDFELIHRVWLDFNSPQDKIPAEKFEKDVIEFLDRVDKLEKGFSAFATDIRKNGDLASNLMTFIQKIAII